MSGGRWVRQDNGDYQHYTDEEIAEQEFSKGVLFGAAMAIVGPYLLISNIGNIGDSFYAGCICTLAGIISLIMAPKETFIIMIFYAIVGGLIWYFCWPSSSDTEKKEKKETKTEIVSEPPKTQNVYASNYSSEMVDADIVTQDNEVIEAGENINEENTFLEETSDESLNTQNVQDCRPSFPGGEEALYKYVCDNLNYPVVAEENGIQGKVKVEFDVMEDGSVQKVKVV